MSPLSALTLTAAILTACMGAMYLGGRLWERRYGPSSRFRFNEYKAYMAGGAVVTVLLLIVTAIAGF